MRNDRIQSFPFGHWKREFFIAKKLNLVEIDWIFDDEGFEKNPIWSADGRKEIRKTTHDTGVAVNFVCADFFMANPFFSCTSEESNKRKTILKKLITYTKDIGAKSIEIPVLDNSEITNEKEKEILGKVLKGILPWAKRCGIEINLETSLPPLALKEFLEKINHPSLKITYDTGNSASLGYNPKEEFFTYGKWITNIHIKDRVLHGNTVPLGKGDTDFKSIFQTLKEIGYKGNFILQAAREEDGKEVNTILSYVEFLKKYINRC